MRDGRLAWYRSCTTPDSPCSQYAWRYRLRTGTYQRAPTTSLFGVLAYVDAGDRLYQEVACTPPFADLAVVIAHE